MGPAMTVEGGTTTEVFAADVGQVLAPALRPGHVVVVDDLAAHHAARARELVEARGAELVNLAAYSPDLNPIEEAFSKVKTGCGRRRPAPGRRWSKRSARPCGPSPPGTPGATSPTAATRSRLDSGEGRCQSSGARLPDARWPIRDAQQPDART